MEEEYRSLYNMLSSDAHSNMRALLGRHVEASGDDFDVVYYKDIPLEAFIYVLDTTAGLLVAISMKIHAQYASPNQDHVNQLHNELTDLRKEYAA